MSVFIPRSNKNTSRAAEYFLKLSTELDMDKYNLPKYKELFLLASFQAMHDTDLAYYVTYQKCAVNAQSKDQLLNCIAQEQMLNFKHPKCFDEQNFRGYLLKALAEIKKQIEEGALDYLFI